MAGYVQGGEEVDAGVLAGGQAGALEVRQHHRQQVLGNEEKTSNFKQKSKKKHKLNSDKKVGFLLFKVVFEGLTLSEILQQTSIDRNSCTTWSS